MTIRIELGVALSVAGLPRHHRGHESAVSDFADCVRSTPGTVLRQGDEESGSPGDGPLAKGALHELSLVVDGPSAAAIAAAAAAVFRTWMHRDRRRTVRVQIKSPNSGLVELVVEGDDVSLKTLETAIVSAAKLQTAALKGKEASAGHAED